MFHHDDGDLRPGGTMNVYYDDGDLRPGVTMNVSS